MFKTVSAKDFKAVPYLETSALMQSHPKGVKFSQKKPNVIIGPNGAGKSALLKALSLQTLSHFTGESSFDDHYVTGNDCKDFWASEGYWAKEFHFLPGLTCATDNAPALYYRPSHIPGNDDSIAASMMCGYFDKAKKYGQLVKEKSSGQQSQALLEKLRTTLSSSKPELAFSYINWRFGKVPQDFSDRKNQGGNFNRPGDYEYQAEILKKTYGTQATDAIPVLLMDEPEQSLDTKAEIMLWKQIEAADTSRLQIIVATHSLYPLLHPKAFNLIEAVPGYIDEVQRLVSQ